MSQTGKLLIAPPSVKGNFWAKTVIYVTEDHDRGSVGLVLNKPSKMSIVEFSKQNDIDSDIPGFIHIGGPMSVNALTMLHSSEWDCANTMQINKEFSLSSSPDLLRRIALGDTPNAYRLFAGLCAWSPDQLDNECQGLRGYHHDYSWLIASATVENVLETDVRSQWSDSIEHCSLEFVQNILV